MTEETGALIIWNGVLGRYQILGKYRRGKIGDGRGNVTVPGSAGYSWIRYDDSENKLSFVRNMDWGGLPHDTPVIVGKKYPTDGYEQVLGVYNGPYMGDTPVGRRQEYAVPKHGPTHQGIASDPAPIDLENLVIGRVVRTDPSSTSVNVYMFPYPYGNELRTFVASSIDLAAYIPGVAGHRYVLVYLNTTTETLAAVGGDIVPVPVTPELPAIPDGVGGAVPLGIVTTYFGQTTIETTDIQQWKAILGVIGGAVATHTHTDDTSGGTSIIGLEEFMLACWEPIYLVGDNLWPTHTYHEIYIPTLYVDAWPEVVADLVDIHPDPVYGCGQILILKAANPGLYGTYRVNVRHGVGNIYLSGGEDIVLEDDRHLLLIYDGSKWHDFVSSYNKTPQKGYGCNVWRSDAHSIPSGAWEPMEFDREEWDTDDCFDTADPKKLYARRAGYYAISVGASFAADANNTRMIGIRQNGVKWIKAATHVPVTGWMGLSIAAVGVYMEAGDYVQGMLQQDTGAPLDTVSTADSINDQSRYNMSLILEGD